MFVNNGHSKEKHGKERIPSKHGEISNAQRPLKRDICKLCRPRSDITERRLLTRCIKCRNVCKMYGNPFDDKWAATWQNQQNGCAPSEESDQSGHPPSLIRVFAVRMKKHWILSYPVSAQRRLWSAWGNAQADLSFRWVHTHFVGFVMSWLQWSSARIYRSARDVRKWKSGRKKWETRILMNS